MKFAVWISFNYSPRVGGSFSYSDRLIKSIDSYTFAEGIDVCFATTYFTQIGSLNRDVVRIGSPFELILSKIPFIAKNRRFQGLMWKLFNHKYKKYLKNNGIKILFYSSQFDKYVKDFPFIAPHWDIAHRSTYAFPEFSIVLQDWRDKYYSNFLPRALMVFVESNAGKEELIKYTNLNEERIKVVPIFAGECASYNISQEEQDRIISQLGLTRHKYFFYPAQFIAEKNHFNVLKAFSVFVKDHPDYKLIFTGNSPDELLGNIEYIKQSALTMGIADKVVFGGFVPLETIYCLYKNACAHIMASYVGPTNMPPLEAMTLGCPVICTDLSGHQEEMQDAALYFDAKNPNQLSERMREMSENRNLYVQKINNRLKTSEFTIENALNRINEHFIEASKIRSAWE